MIETLHLSLPGLGAILFAAFVGSLVQGSIGYGLNLIVVPIVAMIQPEALPGAMIVMAVPMSAGSALREWDSVDRDGVFWLTLGRLPGVLLGTWIVVVLSAETLAIGIGGFVVLAALMSVVSSSRFRVTRVSGVLTGFVSGVMGTTSSIGGPPIAMLYQNQHGPVLRSTLGAAFTVGTSLSLVSLQVAGQLQPFHWWLGLSLFPAIALGLYASRFTHQKLDAGWLRPCVLGFSGLAGASVLLRGLI